MSKDRGYVVLAWTAIFAALGSLAVSIWTAVFVHAHSPTAEQMDGGLPLAQVLRQSGLSPETGAMEASFRMSLHLQGVAVPGVYLRAPRGWPEAQLNGKTGENLNPPR